MSYTASELETAVLDYDGWYSIFYGKVDELPGVGTVKMLDSYGGECQGNDLWVVFSVTGSDGTRTWRKNGWYASFVGGEWDGYLEEVVAQPKVVTEWVKI